MKKVLLFLGVVLMMTSCTTIVKTATTANAPASLLSATVADLEVAPSRVTSKIDKVPAKIRRGGVSNVKQAVEAQALAEYGGNYDLLVEPEYVIEQTSYFIFGKKIKSISVSGRPAKFKNFHSLDDKVWCDPIFRGTYKNDKRNSGGGLLKGLFK